MNLYDYKTKRALFKNMKDCSIEAEDNTIVMSPSHHGKLEAWDGNGFMEEDVKVILLPFDRQKEESYTRKKLYNSGDSIDENL